MTVQTYVRASKRPSGSSLQALKKAIRDPKAEAILLLSADGHRYVRVRAATQEATFGIETAKRLKGSRGLMRQTDAIRKWLAEHRSDLLETYQETPTRSQN